MVVVDRIAVIPQLPEPGKTQYTTKPIEEYVGGHPANVAIDLVKLGLKPSLIGIVAGVGRDSSGKFIKQTIASYGIKSFLKEKNLPTGQDLIIVPEGHDRIFNISPGANLELNLQDIDYALAKHKPKIFSIRPGYSGIDDKIVDILRGLKESGIFIFLDLMRPYKKDWDYICAALPFASCIHCNDIEAMNITRKNTVQEAMYAFLDYGVDLVLITTGEGGAKLATAKTFITQPAFRVKTVDPTGCGDAFCAGIIKKFIDWGLPDISTLSLYQLDELLSFAQAVGGACATGIGSTTGISIAKVIEIMKGGERYE